MKCIPVVGTVNTLWFQKGSKCYEHLGKHQTETRRKGVCYMNFTECWGYGDRLKSTLLFGAGFGRVLSLIVLRQGSNLTIICLNKQTQKNTTFQEWDIM